MLCFCVFNPASLQRTQTFDTSGESFSLLEYYIDALLSNTSQFFFNFKRFCIQEIYFVRYSSSEGLLARGIRQYFVDSCKGRQIVGSVMRTVDNEYGQSLMISITAAPSVSDDFQRDVLDSGHWGYVTKNVEMRHSMPNHRQFTILTSSRNAVKGPNSDPIYDHISLQDRKSSRNSDKHG